MKQQRPRRWAIAGIVFMLIGIPTILQLVPPNSYWGFRTAKTFSDKRIWYAANRVMGIDLFLAGLVIVIGVMVTAKRIRRNPRLANRICFSIFLLCSLAALAHGYWALGRM
ncbi:MAG: SdpI family protein [Blastocatellales bacterium]